MLKYYSIESNITAFSTQRAGGCSINNYASLNVNPYCGDSLEAVAKNRTILCQELGIAEDHLVLPHQTHDTQLKEIDSAFLQLPKEEQQAQLEGMDALYTREKGICISVSTADCIPVLLYSKKDGLVAAIHAGWRGTCARIVEKTLQQLKEKHGVKGEDFQAVIGPGISLDSFEVGNEVYEAFQNAGFEMAPIAKKYPAAVGEKWHIDLWECNRRQLLVQGLKAENIQVAGICTYQHSDEFFSARKLGIHSGRILTGILRK